MMAENLGAEKAVHGRPWNHVHGGYFSDPAVARPLVEAVREVQTTARPDALVDLGGGTGFLLSQLREAGIGGEPVLVNLDCSETQLEVAGLTGITSVCGSMDAFRREEVVPVGRTALFLMRSVLHYAGESGLTPLLLHIRAQMAAGEVWVHQTACFERPEDADCLNALYRKMRTGKWYPAIADLRKRLGAAGWRVVDVRPAPTLILDSGELGRRYGLGDSELGRIRQAMADEFGGQAGVFHLLPAGFRAELPYRIFICSAEA